MSSGPPGRITFMDNYLELNGVRTWYDERGDGEPLLLLHGGLTDSRDFAGNLDALADHFRVFMPERRGHGHTPDHPGPITVDVMAADTIAFVEEVVGKVVGAGRVRMVGYSAGAAVALVAAVRRPDLVERLVLISGAFDPAGMIVKPTAGGTPPEPLVARYAEVSPDGRDHFPVVIKKIADAASRPGLAPAELAAVGCPALVMAADDDLVTLEHTLALYRALPEAQLAVVPGTSHLLLHERPRLCASLVTEFLTTDPAPLMPLTRAPASDAR
jgi:pimeloyl-ACP methyl ester carboxylesterase